MKKMGRELLKIAAVLGLMVGLGTPPERSR